MNGDSHFDAPSPAAYATDPAASRGRLHSEPESESRTPFQRDRDRILHSTAFRRLKHKTQVFVYHEGDHYRTRLTHSLEVAQIARTIARTLRLNEDLAEALALSHDLGHPPFGHAGEEALDRVMSPYGGFDHNAQTLRVLTKLERRYASFDGLNLTWETLEGVVKHNGPLTGPHAMNATDQPLHENLLDYVSDHDLELGTFASAEAQVAAIADDIAYNNHDLDDGLRAGLFDLGDLDEVPLVAPVLSEVRTLYPDIERPRAIHETIRRLISVMITDVVTASVRRLNEVEPTSVDDVRHADRLVIGMSEEMGEGDRALREFLFANMYRHDKVNQMSDRGRQVIAEIFQLYLHEPQRMPEEWRETVLGSDPATIPRLACDFIAGMTDRYALSEHERLFG
ncbi:MAG: deoxyguanosinetriphosphate triphosphohydrolase [Alphaproteobacteria bacterium]|nr:deoxyguanosinetriphosphate triphosphohydrolase [Alphaproteobacteria bacterium]|tara:strand:- start:2370 stop:3560 length:1191 start_codon:yes stop_codon:yes gene_type:complete